MPPRRVQRDRKGFASMVLVMGSTGSGKSYFINKLKEGATVVSDSLYSCTYSLFWGGMFTKFQLRIA
jgi:septin family protein